MMMDEPEKVDGESPEPVVTGVEDVKETPVSNTSVSDGTPQPQLDDPFPGFAGPSLEELTNGVAAASGAKDAAFSDDGFEPIPETVLDELRRDITAAIKTVYDPEIPVDIYELGLIYMVDIHNDRSVDVEMTLTSPGCPVAGDMPGWVVDAIAGVDGVKAARVRLSFDPPWDMSMMSDEARFALNMF